MMLVGKLLTLDFLAGCLGDELYKISETASAPYGNPPNQRSVEQLLESSVIVINKQSGPSSHQVAAWLRDSFELELTGHGGTLDPDVTGVLPITIGKSSKATKVLQESSKEYMCLLELSKSFSQDKIQSVLNKFIGPIYQIPPHQAAVKRDLRIRRIYDIELLEHTSKSTLFRVECEGGTYIRNLCEDIGSILGVRSKMAQLIRTKAGPFRLEDSVTLVEAHDLFQSWKETKNDAALKSVLRPLEEMLVDIPVMEVKDSAVDALCHGAELGIPGLSSISKEIKRGQLVSIITTRGESVALARATMNANEIVDNLKGKGKVARLERVIMQRGTYPREWKSR